MSIEFEAVSMRFRDGTVAVRDFSLVVPPHRTVALVVAPEPSPRLALDSLVDVHDRQPIRRLDRVEERDGGCVAVAATGRPQHEGSQPCRRVSRGSSSTAPASPRRMRSSSWAGGVVPGKP